MYVQLTQSQEDLLEIVLTQLGWFIFKDLPVSGLRISREGPEYSPFPRGPLYMYPGLHHRFTCRTQGCELRGSPCLRVLGRIPENSMVSY